MFKSLFMSYLELGDWPNGRFEKLACCYSDFRESLMLICFRWESTGFGCLGFEASLSPLGRILGYFSSACFLLSTGTNIFWLDGLTLFFACGPFSSLFKESDASASSRVLCSIVNLKLANY